MSAKPLASPKHAQNRPASWGYSHSHSAQYSPGQQNASPPSARPRITPELEKRVQAVYADADDTSAHPVITLTKSHSGHLAKLTLEGTPLEKDFVVHDEFGEVLGGVGMVLHQEASWGIYVAQVTPGGPAAAGANHRHE